MLDLHRFILAIARVSVNHDDKGTAPDPLVWDQRSRPKVRKLAIRVNVDLASGPPGFLNSSWVQVNAGHITGSDIAARPYSVGILVKFTSFLNTLHWPSGSADLGHFGISFLELLILFEQWAGHRLLSERVTWPHVRANRPILLPSVPLSEGIGIRHGCQCLSRLVRALAKLPGGLGRFLPCRVGSHLSRLRHLGWNQCSHGLTSGAVCGVVGYPKGSALDGTLKLRHCTDLFTMRFLPWSLPRIGNGGGKRQFVTPGHPFDAGGDVCKRVRLTRKTRPGVFSHHNPGPGHPTPRRWKRLRSLSSEGVGVRWASLAIFFLALGLGEVLLWECLEPAFEGYRHREFPAGQSSRRDWCNGASPL